MDKWVALTVGPFERENLSFFFSPIFAEYLKVTLIGDSLAKHLSGLHGVILQIFSGQTFSQISAKYKIMRLIWSHMIMLLFM